MGGGPPATRRERRLAERRAAERRTPDGEAYDGPERRVGERRGSERREALRAERAAAEELRAAEGRTALAAAQTEPLDVLSPNPPAGDPAPHPSELPTEAIDVPGPVPAPSVLPTRRTLRESHDLTGMPGPDASDAPPSAAPSAHVPPPRRPAPQPASAFEPVAVPYLLPPDDRGVVGFLRRLDPLTVWLVVLVVAGGLVLSMGAIRAMSGPEPVPYVADPVPAGTSRTLLLGVGSPDGLLVGAVLGEDSGAPVSLLLPGDALVDDGDGPAPLSGAATSSPTGGTPTPATSATPGAATTGPATLATTGPSGAADLPPAAVVTRTADRLSAALGVRLDASWLLGPAGLAGLVDAAGGVQVDVDRSVTAQRLGLRPGPARLTGTQAAGYVTGLAANEQAEARLSRFQQVLSAVVLALPADRARLGAVVAGLAPEATGTAPDAVVADLLAAVRAAAGGEPLPGTIVPLRLVTNDDGDLVGRALDTTAGRALVARLLPGAVAGAGRVAVRLVDGTGRPGLTDAALSRLRAAGLGAQVTVGATTTATDGATGGATARPVPRSVVEVAGADEAAKEAGARVATALGLPADAVRLGEATGGADVRVVLGPDFAADVANNGV